MSWSRRSQARTSTDGVPAARRAGTRLGEDLRKVIPWLKTESPARIGPALARIATATQPWTAHDVEIALTDLSRRRGYRAALTADHIATLPAVVLAGLLRELDPEAEHPTAAAFPENDPHTLPPARVRPRLPHPPGRPQPSHHRTVPHTPTRRAQPAPEGDDERDF